MKPLDEDEIKSFLAAIKGHRFEDIFIVTLFTGMREGEVLGLTWDCVDFARGIITINKQMQLHQEKGMAAYQLVSTKNGKSRTVTAAPSVLAQLRHRRATQNRQRIHAGELWQDSGLVFTDDLGRHLTKPTVYRSFKKVAASIGRPDARFHDLRHPNVKPKTQIFYIQNRNPRTLLFSVLGFLFCEYLILQIYSSCHKFESRYNYISNFAFN